MDKKLPRIFRNDIDKEIHNNRKVYYVKSEGDDFTFSTRKEKKENFDRNSKVQEKLNAIFKPGRHSFNVGVEIVTASKTYDTKIAGKVRDCLINLDNDVIPLKDVLDIRVK